MKKKLALLLSLMLLGICAVRLPEYAGIAEQASETASDFTAVIDTKEMDFTFTSRELEGTYEAMKAVEITGSGATATASSSGVSILEDHILIAKEGVYVLSGEFNDLCIVVDAPDTDKVQLVLNGASLLSASGPCIYIRSADKVFLTLPEGTESSLCDGESYAVSDGDTAIDAALFSRSDLCINGKGALSVTGRIKHGIVSKDDLIITGVSLQVMAASTALDGKDCVMVNGAALTLTAGSNGVRSDNAEDENRGYVYLLDSTLTIDAQSDGIQAETVLACENTTLTITAGGGSGSSLRNADGSWKGMKAGSDLYIGGGSYTISSRDDCIHANGSIHIAGGDLTLSSGDDGVHADDTLTVAGGNLNIGKSYEGLEASKLLIRGGSIRIVASDDGLNAAGGADGSAAGNRFGRGMFSNGVGEIEISGGYTVINASGDGVDSNSSIRVTGGVTLVSGPVSNGNAAFDYDGEATLTGGVLIACGASGMAQNFSSAENQGAMLLTLNRSQSGSIALLDAEGRAIVSFTPDNTFQSIMITAPEIQQGQTYTLVSGGSIDGADENGFARNAAISGGTVLSTITMDSLLYGSGGFGMRQQPGGMWDRQPGGGGGGGGDWGRPGR